jgi:putative FmdB family regulatory protein
MPTYTYRCQQCQQEQAVVHGMLEAPMLICAHCGHFCEKVVISAPTVLAAESPKSAEQESPPAPRHDCGANCALHRPRPSSKPASLTD